MFWSFALAKKKHGEKSKIKEDKSPTKVFSLFEIKQKKINKNKIKEKQMKNCKAYNKLQK